METAAAATWRDLALVMVTSTLAGTTLALVSPLTSLVMDSHGWSDTLIGANTAMHGLGIFLVAPFVGVLTARLGAVGCMQLALLVIIAAILTMPMAVEPWLWFPLRLLIGTGSGLLFIMSEAAVNALAPESDRGRLIGLYGTLFSVGYTAGPLVVAVAGHEGWPPFLVAAGLLAVGLVPASLTAAATRALAGTSHARPKVMPVIRRAPLAIATVFVFGFVEAAFFGLLPLWGLAVDLSEAQAATVLSAWIAGNIVLQIPLGWAADRFGRRDVTVACTVLSLLTLAVVGRTVAHPWLLWPLLALMGGVMGGLYTLAMALLGQSFKGSEMAVAATGFVVIFEVGAVLGPALLGAGIDVLGAGTLPWLSMVPLLLLLAVAPRLRSPVA